MSDRQLAEAWRDLAGWHVGMVDVEGEVYDGRTDWNEEPGILPDLDSPANWGHWHDFVDLAVGGASLKRSCKWWVAETKGGSMWTAEHENRGTALLELWCRDGEWAKGTWPPSVLAWWKSQQGEVSDE